MIQELRIPQPDNKVTVIGGGLNGSQSEACWYQGFRGDRARRGYRRNMEVRRDAPGRFMDLMWRNGENLRYYFTELNGGVHLYFVNRAGESPILRATSILAARGASRSFPPDDYEFAAPARFLTLVPGQANELKSTSSVSPSNEPSIERSIENVVTIHI